jgi:hypothetical protein
VPLASAHIAQIHAAIDAPTHEPAVGEFGPISGTDNTGIAGTHVKKAVGIAAERELLFEPIHECLGLFLQLKVAEK